MTSPRTLSLQTLSALLLSAPSCWEVLFSVFLSFMGLLVGPSSTSPPSTPQNMEPGITHKSFPSFYRIPQSLLTSRPLLDPTYLVSAFPFWSVCLREAPSICRSCPSPSSCPLEQEGHPGPLSCPPKVSSQDSAHHCWPLSSPAASTLRECSLHLLAEVTAGCLTFLPPCPLTTPLVTKSVLNGSFLFSPWPLSPWTAASSLLPILQSGLSETQIAFFFSLQASVLRVTKDRVRNSPRGVQDSSQCGCRVIHHPCLQFPTGHAHAVHPRPPRACPCHVLCCFALCTGCLSSLPCSGLETGYTWGGGSVLTTHFPHC